MAEGVGGTTVDSRPAVACVLDQNRTSEAKNSSFPAEPGRNAREKVLPVLQIITAITLPLVWPPRPQFLPAVVRQNRFVAEGQNLSLKIFQQRTLFAG